MNTCFDTFVDAVSNSSDRKGILGGDFLVVPPKEEFAAYWCEPTNVLTFASMGVDGVHYAIVKIDSSIEEDSPVIHISPMDGDPYCVLAPTFLEYLADGCEAPIEQMDEVVAQQRSGTPVLVQFLKQRFDHSRLYDDARLARLKHLLRFVECNRVT
jgi:hypothetical protein